MSEKHSAVCYIFREGAFSPVREAKPFHNDFGLDLFQYKGAVYEGRTGLQFCPLKQAEDIASVIGKHGGLEKVQKLIADSLERTGLSPRYTRPNEKKKDIFPPKEKDENRVFAKDLMGNKHYYYRFYNENGICLLYTSPVSLKRIFPIRTHGFMSLKPMSCNGPSRKCSRLNGRLCWPCATPR